MIKKHTPKTQKLSREENVGEITQGVHDFWKKLRALNVTQK